MVLSKLLRFLASSVVFLFGVLELLIILYAVLSDWFFQTFNLVSILPFFYDRTVCAGPSVGLACLQDPLPYIRRLYFCIAASVVLFGLFYWQVGRKYKLTTFISEVLLFVFYIVLMRWT